MATPKTEQASAIVDPADQPAAGALAGTEIVSVLVAGVAKQTTTSAIGALVGPSTGSGPVVLQNSPTLVAPNIGAATATSVFATGGSPPLATSMGAQLWATANSGYISIVNPSAPANSRISDIYAPAGSVSFRFVNDAYNSVVTWLNATGTAAGVTGIASNSGSGSWTHTGALSVTGVVTLSTPLGIASGGTGATTAAAALTALLSGSTVPVANGGTGSTTAAAARTALGTAASGANSDITSVTGLTTALSVAQGGTGLATITAHGVMVGEGTSNVTTAAPVSAGYVLTDNGAGVDPSFQAIPDLSGKNRIINGAMVVDQRNAGAAQTITAGAALAYTVDRWYAYSTGANVTGQQTTGTGGVGQPRKYYSFSGAASVTGIGFGQRIESANSADLAGTTATLSAVTANSQLTTVTWTAYYANSTDSFGTLASPTRTQIATGTFAVNGNYTRYSAQIAIPAAATTGIEIVFSVGAQTSGAWAIGDVQVKAGGAVTPFEHRQYGQELALSQRYRESGNWNITYPTTTAGQWSGAISGFRVTKRATPTITVTPVGGASAAYQTSSAYIDGIFINVSSTGASGAANVYGTYTADAEL